MGSWIKDKGKDEKEAEKGDDSREEEDRIVREMREEWEIEYNNRWK